MTSELMLLALALAAVPLGAQTPRASVEITAKTRDSVPVSGVVIELTPVGGQRLTLTTDSSGRVRAAGLEPGTARLSARKVGFRPGDLRAVLGPGQNTIPLLFDAAIVPTLAEVRVLGGREVLARHSEFEGRRALGLANASFTAEDIRKRNPLGGYEMLRAIPSVRVAVVGANTVHVQTTRGSCYLQLVVDGIQVQPRPGSPANMADMPPPSDIHGLEVFSTLALVPPQYASQVGAGIPGGPKICGLVAVWTK